MSILAPRIILPSHSSLNRHFTSMEPREQHDGWRRYGRILLPFAFVLHHVPRLRPAPILPTAQKKKHSSNNILVKKGTRIRARPLWRATLDERKKATSPDDAGGLLGSAGKILNPAQWPKRVRVVILCFVSFVICNCDRINISVAILPMAKYYGWSQTTVGIIQSSFFWGYVLTQIPGGYLADLYGGKHVLAAGVITWSAMTLLTPAAASSSIGLLLLTRALLGVGEGVAMPAMNNMISKWVPESERSRSLSLTYSGMYLGSVLGLLLCPTFIVQFGWQSVFYIFGALGFFWWIAWQFLVTSSPETCKSLSDREREYISQNMPPERKGPGNLKSVPWKLLLSRKETWAIIVAHFCVTWGTYQMIIVFLRLGPPYRFIPFLHPYRSAPLESATNNRVFLTSSCSSQYVGYFVLLIWLPTYFNQQLGFELAASSFLSVVPWLAMFISANAGGFIADAMRARDFSITTVRKTMQSIGFLGPALFLGLVATTKAPALAVTYMTIALALGSFSQSGVYSNHQDIGPDYAGILLGIR